MFSKLYFIAHLTTTFWKHEGHAATFMTIAEMDMGRVNPRDKAAWVHFFLKTMTQDAMDRWV